MFGIVEENLYIIAHFTKYRLFLDWFQVMLVVSWLVSGSFRWFRSFQVVSRFSKYINVFKKAVYRLEGAYPGNSVGRGGKIMSQLLC